MRTTGVKVTTAFSIMIGITVLLYFLSSSFSVNKVNVADNLLTVNVNGIKAVYSLLVEKPEADKSYYLNLKTRGSTVKVLVNGDMIYEYGNDLAKENQLVGKVFSSLLLPDSAYAGNLIIETQLVETYGTTDIETAELCDSDSQQRYFVTNETLGGLLGPVFLVLSCVLVIGAVLFGLKNGMGMRMLLFGLIIFGMSGIIFDTGGHYLMFTSDQHAWNIFCRIDFYLLPAFCVWYFGLIGKTLLFKRIAYIGTIIIFSLLAVTCIVTFTAPDRAIVDFRPVLYVAFVVTGVVIATGIYWLVKNGLYSKRHIPIAIALALWFGVMLFLLFGPTSIATVMNRSGFGLKTVTILLMLFLLSYIFITQVKKEYREKKEKEDRNLVLEEQIIRAQLQNYNNQIQPHFIYNVLSSIRQIVYEDPDYAAALLSEFSIHLRGMIRAMSNDKKILFSEELKNIKAYVNIEKARLGDRLTVNYDIQEQDFEIMPLCIQPIVENAIRHGIFFRGQTGGSVTLKTEEKTDVRIIQVIDNGVGFDVQKVLAEADRGEKDSIGLKNIIFRIEKQMNATVKIESVINEGTTVTVEIPKHQGDER